MATIHRAAFAGERGWSAQEIADLLAQPYTAALEQAGGFALTRTLAGETELLTLAVAPDHRRRGTASALLTQWIGGAATQAETAFLEVAADNHGALALYTKHGFHQTGQRRGYYPRAGAAAVDALLLSRALTRG